MLIKPLVEVNSVVDDPAANSNTLDAECTEQGGADTEVGSGLLLREAPSLGIICGAIFIVHALSLSRRCCPIARAVTASRASRLTVTPSLKSDLIDEDLPLRSLEADRSFRPQTGFYVVSDRGLGVAVLGRKGGDSEVTGPLRFPLELAGHLSSCALAGAARSLKAFDFQKSLFRIRV